MKFKKWNWNLMWKMNASFTPYLQVESDAILPGPLLN